MANKNKLEEFFAFISNMKQMDEEKARRASQALCNIIQENLRMIEQILEQKNKNMKDIEELKEKLENFERLSTN